MKPVNRLLLGAAWIGALAGCESTPNRAAGPLEPWRAATVLGEPDSVEPGRRDGPVLARREARATAGTIYPGDRPLLRGPGIFPAEENGQVTLNLVQVSIADAAEAVLSGLFGQNYLIDPRVQGTVDIRSSRPIGRRTAFEVFELALKQNGAALVRRDDIYAIVPIGTELGLGIDTQPSIEPGFTIRAVPLRHIGAREMATILQPIAGEGVVAVDEQRNIVVLAGTSVDQVAWQSTITSFDVDWLSNRPVGVFPIRGRSARSVVRGLELLVDTQEGAEPIALFEIIPENNSILAVARTPEALQSVAGWVRRLTRQGQNDARVYSYDMRYARAGEIAGVLGEILGIQVQVPEGAAGAGAGTATQAGALTSFGGLSSGFATQAQMPQIAGQAVNQPPGATSPDAALFGDPLTASQRSEPEGTMNTTRIVASEATNTLLIHATPAEYQRVLGVLDRLDVPPRQVLVEATIIEVTLNDTLRFGVQYFFEREGSDFVLTADPSLGITPALPGFTAIINTPANVVVDALDDLTEVNVISSPNMMVLNNQSARLSVGATVPVAIRQAQEGLEDTDVFASEIEFRDTGVIFEVTPRINSSGSVVLDIRQEVSNVLEPDAETLTPTISQRLLESAIAVDSGETVALGGLFSRDQSNGRSGIPFLVDIPIAGVLFGQRSTSSVRTELLVLITPRIVNNALDARRVTRSLRERVTTIDLTDAALSTAIETPTLETENSRRLRDLLFTSRSTTAPVRREPEYAPEQEYAPEPAASLDGTALEGSPTLAPAPAPAPAAESGAVESPGSDGALRLGPASGKAVSEVPLDAPADALPGEAAGADEALRDAAVRHGGAGGEGAGAYVVLGSFRDPEGPQRRWSSMSSGALAGLSPIYDSAGGLHRVSVGPFDSARARALCASLGADCFVERRGR
ncbi:MAG: type II secretion system secretin GspD [Pseudomonadota bacterium]